MDISKVTVRQLLANPRACELINSVSPDILRHPMLKLVKGKTVKAVFDMVPDGKVPAGEKQKLMDMLSAL